MPQKDSAGEGQAHGHVPRTVAKLIVVRAGRSMHVEPGTGAQGEGSAVAPGEVPWPLIDTGLPVSDNEGTWGAGEGTSGRAIMGIASMSEILGRAARGGYAVGYFESWDQYSFEATLEAAEETRSPLILGFGGAVSSQPWLERWGVEEMAALAHCLAERATVPVAVLFNEARTYAQVLRGLRAGCNAVMLDTSHLPLQENIALTRKVVEAAHALGASVEAELGSLPDASGEPMQGPVASAPQRTDPAEAALFVSRTGVDALAVSIGNTHVLAEGEAAVDLDLLARIHETVPLPLVIHGGTGFPAWAVEPAIQRGVAKINVGTRLKGACLEGIRAAMAQLAPRPNVHRVIGSREEGDILIRGKLGSKAEIVALLRLYGCAGQAE